MFSSLKPLCHCQSQDDFVLCQNIVTMAQFCTHDHNSEVNVIRRLVFSNIGVRVIDLSKIRHLGWKPKHIQSINVTNSSVEIVRICTQSGTSNCRKFKVSVRLVESTGFLKHVFIEVAFWEKKLYQIPLFY